MLMRAAICARYIAKFRSTLHSDQNVNSAARKFGYIMNINAQSAGPPSYSLLASQSPVSCNSEKGAFLRRTPRPCLAQAPLLLPISLASRISAAAQFIKSPRLLALRLAHSSLDQHLNYVVFRDCCFLCVCLHYSTLIPLRRKSKITQEWPEC